MNLFEIIEKIQFENGLNASEFIDKTGFSRNLYYTIKDGSKTSLKPNQLKSLIDAIPNSAKYFTKDLGNKNTKKDISLNELKFNSLKDIGDFVADNFDEVRAASSYFNLVMKEKKREDIKAQLEAHNIKIEYVKDED